LEIRHEVVEWNQMAVSWVQWQALVNMVINIHFHKMQAISEQSNDKWLHKKNCAPCIYKAYKEIAVSNKSNGCPVKKQH
jgi:hypothetical protein